jgi:hypothetical protein
MSQAFELISGPRIQQKLSEQENRIGKLLDGGKSDAQIVDELYWTALSRLPSDEELAAAERHLASTDRRQGLEDVAWALVNAKEFLLRW